MKAVVKFSLLILATTLLSSCSLPTQEPAETELESQPREIAVVTAPPENSRVAPVGIVAADFVSVRELEDGRVWTREFSMPGSTFLSLNFKNEDRDSADFRIVVIGREGDDTMRFDSRQMPVEFWTPAIPGDTATVEIHSDSDLSDIDLAVHNIAALPLAVRARLAIVGPGLPDWEPITNYLQSQSVWQASRAVARLTYEYPSGASDACTGFLISSDHLLTNEHCIDTEKKCESAMAIFGYDDESNKSPDVEETFECEEIVAMDHALDYAILRLAGKPGEKWGVLQLSGTGANPNELAYVTQFPAGYRKHIAMNNCRVVTPVVGGRGPNTDLTHSCDTDGISSGAPVLNLSNVVVGLHHQANSPPEKPYNQAVRIEQIISHASQAIDIF